ncbi:GGDEF domain-containing protein [Sphingomonas sp. CGMCC 1.13654]|uniref:diguanylate cyclase n=1 Tax=Sphingomonas chungangi TaxID=2683589 RepID=A0A838L214_9SPHN|nr:GGDEF domain-containing protein [Sphingomonas chungangi]MBA2933421.1 GGDEF domain-containing protein [Sphingomonas chungangi]MVW54754.1 diguanylate cyclase [Sphingomonas chungangi]
MNGTFAFELPLMHITFGITFLVAARWGERSALYFGIAFLCNAAGFGLPVMPMGLSDLTVAWVTDILFAVSFFFFGQAATQHFGAPRRLLWARLATCAISIALCIYAVVGLDDLHMELLASDAGCVLLLGLAMVGIRWQGLRSFDWVLFVAAWFVTIESVIRGTSSFFTAPSSVEDFGTSQYAYFMQALGSVLGVVFAMAGLSAVALSVLDRYHKMAMDDPLSGLLNRRGFEEALATRPDWRGRPASIVTCDIDRFKTVNDRFGHATGDAVIEALAAILRTRLPEDGIAARFGGEEFLLFLPGRTPADALRIAEGVRTAIEAEAAETVGMDGPITASFGISGVVASDFSVHDAIGRADAALYEAKHGGRNRVALRLLDTVEPETAARSAAPLVALERRTGSRRRSA